MENNKEQIVGGKLWPGRSWTDVIADIAVQNWIDGVVEYRRLVETGLYTKAEHKTLCDFTHFFWCDYPNRFQWCRQNNVIERRGRTVWSTIWYSSPVEEILTVYGMNEINVKGYKGDKHVLELHFKNLHEWKDYEREVLDKYHLATKNPQFIGRRDPIQGISWIGAADFEGEVGKFILEDEPLDNLKNNAKCCSMDGFSI